MKTLCLSDIHADPTVLYRLRRLSESSKYDCILVAGDITGTKNKSEYQAKVFFDTLRGFDCPVYATPGNHDYFDIPIWDNDPLIHVLVDEQAILPNGMKAYLTPWSHEFMGWNWMKPKDELKYNIPEDTQVVVSHAPPCSVLDSNRAGESLGEPALSDAIMYLKDCKAVIFGHIHQDNKRSSHHYGIQYCNVSCVDERYNPTPGFTVLDFNEYGVAYSLDTNY